MIYFCSNKNRRALVLQNPALNGIDYLEVVSGGADCGKQLLLTMLQDARGVTLTTDQVQVTGGVSSAARVSVESVEPGTADAPKVVTVDLNHTGDFSTYTLSLVATPNTTDPPTGFDPQLSTVTFSFKAGCPTVADCAPNDCCPPPAAVEPDINYLAKDFPAFRQVMLDRMSVLSPTWTETHESDIGIALVEAQAYFADHLSYQQDAVGTEAYLGTARSRISARRHAKLVDYKVNEGNNARAWVYIQLAKGVANPVFLPSGTLVFPRVPGFPTIVAPGSPQAAILLASPIGFATMQDAWAQPEQNEMYFYTWEDSSCCLPAGATSATLQGTLTTLQAGTILVFEEVVGPNTGAPGDANPNNRWAVRLTSVRTMDYTGKKKLTDPLNGQAVTQIAWGSEDALPFPLCISSSVANPGGAPIPLANVSVVLGNIIPADHGIWQDQPLDGTVSLTNGSSSLAGLGTSFTNEVQPGQWLIFSTDLTQTPYVVETILSDTSLTFAPPYAGTTTLPPTPLTPPTYAAVLQTLGLVPAPPTAPVLASSCTCDSNLTLPANRPRYYPELANSPVTFAYAANMSVELAGTVALTNGSEAVMGTGTLFSEEIKPGQPLVFSADSSGLAYTVASIASDTSLTLATPFAGTTTLLSNATVPTSTPASQFLATPTSPTARAKPQLAVYDDQGEEWTVLDDLLSSNDTQRVCVIEIENNGAAFLRFGDGQYGIAVEQNQNFIVRYRVGNGTLGNIGRESLAHILTTAQGIAAIDNPLPAAGGVDPETITHIRQNAPFAFQTQLRAVTEDDYGIMATLNPAISQARGTLRWTGSWYTAFVSEETVSGLEPDAALLASTKSALNLYRMMGVDLEVEGAVFVGLEIVMHICVDPNYFQADVETALMQLFISGDQCDGKPGLLNPKNFTFGQTIYLSPFVAAAQGVQGVSSVTMVTFERMDSPSTLSLNQGYITMGRLEIARCDNDPDRLDLGVFTLQMEAGK